MEIDYERIKGKKESFSVLNLATVEESLKRWKSYLPDIRPSIDLRSTSCPEAISRCIESGCLLTYQEYVYWNIMKDNLKVDSISPILDLGANTISSCVKQAVSSGICRFCVDCIEDLESFKPFGSEVKLFLRLCCPQNTAFPGISDKDIRSVISLAVGSGLSIEGIVMHLNDMDDVNVFEKQMKEIVEISKDMGVRLTHLHIIEEGLVNFIRSNPEVALLEEKLNGCREIWRAEGWEVSAEASRYLLEKSFTIYTRVIGVKHKKTSEETINLVYTDNGVYCSFFDAFINKESIIPIPVRAVGPEEVLYKTTVFGPTCDSIDTLGDDYRLPEMKVGEWFVYRGNGYLCNSYYSLFNGFETPQIIIVNE